MSGRHRKPRTRTASRVRMRLDRYTDRSTPLVVLTASEWLQRHPD